MGRAATRQWPPHSRHNLPTHVAGAAHDAGAGVVVNVNAGKDAVWARLGKGRHLRRVNVVNALLAAVALPGYVRRKRSRENGA